MKSLIVSTRVFSRQGTSSQYQNCYLDPVSLFVSSTNSIQIVRRQCCIVFSLMVVFNLIYLFKSLSSKSQHWPFNPFPILAFLNQVNQGLLDKVVCPNFVFGGSLSQRFSILVVKKCPKLFGQACLLKCSMPKSALIFYEKTSHKNKRWRYKLLYNAKRLACMPIHIVREGQNAIGMG